MQTEVRVKGYREAVLALGRVNRLAKPIALRTIASSAMPLAEDVRARLSRYRGASLGTIGTAASTKGVFVRQRKRKVTGFRGDFGALQMTRGFIPAAYEHGDEIAEDVEAALGVVIRLAGLHEERF